MSLSETATTGQGDEASRKSPVAKAIARPRGNDEHNILAAHMKFLKNANHEISKDLQQTQFAPLTRKFEGPILVQQIVQKEMLSVW